MSRICAVKDCGRPAHGVELCVTHYWRKRRGLNVYDHRIGAKPESLVGKRFHRWTVIAPGKGKPNKREGRGGRERTVVQNYWRCRCDCGTVREVREYPLRKGQSHSCGCYVSDFRKQQTREKATNWKGGRRVSNGYVLIKDHSHPNADSHGYVAEHRFVMAQQLGRPLRPSELVHHKNGVRDDNRPENLEIVTNSNHRGEVTCPHCQKLFQLL